MLSKTDLLINSDGSIFHLKLKPGEVATIVFLVGDPSRVEAFKPFLHNIETERSNREFRTLTGYYKNKRISVHSTGIGVGNVDISINELDALHNIDFKNREIKENPISLQFIRVGTTGTIQSDIKPGTSIVSKHAIGFDSMAQFIPSHFLNMALHAHLKYQIPELFKVINAYCIDASYDLAEKFSSKETFTGITLTAPGFYAAQGRILRIPSFISPAILEQLSLFEWQGNKILNFEMESSTLFHYARLLGHAATSICLALANRHTGEALTSYNKHMHEHIENSLKKLILHPIE
jgi:uridine phosphorylase